MDDTRNSPESSLPAADLFRFEEICWRFEADLRADKLPKVEDYLEDMRDPERSTLRKMLLAIETEFQGGVALPGDSIRSKLQGDWAGEQTVERLDPLTDERSAGAPLWIGRYRVEKVLGQGTFGTVYLAHDEELKRAVAIKVPRAEQVRRPEDVELYLTEAQVVAALDHPAIVPVYDVGRTDAGWCYVVSKYVEGTDLKTRIAERRPAHRESAELIAAVAEALHYAHRRGLAHRDIKPANILLDENSQPHVADFGLALQEENVGKGPKFAGSPAYMSPEQARGESHRVDGRSDIFSLGVVFYELLTGRPPFRADSQPELLEQIATFEPRPPRQIDDTIPKPLERVCLKAMSKRATERYTTARDLADDLRAFLAEQRGDSVLRRRSPRPPRLGSGLPERPPLRGPTAGP